MFLAQDKWVSFVKHAAPNRGLPWISSYIFKQQYKPFPKLKGLFKYLLPTYGIFILLAAAINNPGSSELSVVYDLQGKSWCGRKQEVGSESCILPSVNF